MRCAFAFPTIDKSGGPARIFSTKFRSRCLVTRVTKAVFAREDSSSALWPRSPLIFSEFHGSSYRKVVKAHWGRFYCLFKTSTGTTGTTQASYIGRESGGEKVGQNV